MTIRSKAEELANFLTPMLILTVCCLASQLIAINIRCHGSLAQYLYDDLPLYYARNEVHWLGASHGMFVYMFVPLIAGVIDHFKISYRICMVASGVGSLLSSVLSAGFSDPGFMIITDTVAAGGSASVMLATIILVVDDHFPRESNLRVFATTMVQGVAIATFLLIDVYSLALKLAGWRIVFYGYGASVCAIGIFGAVLFSRPQRSLNLQHRAGYAPLPVSPEDVHADEDPEADVAQEDAPSNSLAGAADNSVIDQLFEKKDWKKRLLSLSQDEMDSSRTCLLWMCERLLAAVVSDGFFLFLLLHSDIARHPFIAGATPSPNIRRITTAFVFTIGSTTSYIGGGILGCLLRGRLLVMHMTGALLNLCALIGWLAVLNSFYHGELIMAWFCGLGVGAINTFAFAASEEATGIPARSIFPFTKLTNGLSIVTIEIINSAVGYSRKSQMEVLLIVLLMLSLAQFSLLVLIRHINQRLDAFSNRFKPSGYSGPGAAT